MTTLDIEIAVMEGIGIRANLVVPNISWGIVANMHECDILWLSKKNYATEVEIKVSKSDLLKDKEKWHGHHHNHVARLYFAVPEKLQELALKEIPERAGLYVVKIETRQTMLYGRIGQPYQVTVLKEVRSPKRNMKAHQWTDEERSQLARLGAMRILGLKQKIQKLKTLKK